MFGRNKNKGTKVRLVYRPEYDKWWAYKGYEHGPLLGLAKTREGALREAEQTLARAKNAPQKETVYL